MSDGVEIIEAAKHPAATAVYGGFAAWLAPRLFAKLFEREEKEKATLEAKVQKLEADAKAAEARQAEHDRAEVQSLSAMLTEVQRDMRRLVDPELGVLVRLGKLEREVEALKHPEKLT